MAKFEKVQQDILDATYKNQLVSAGAGSGKTTVMIQKISSMILSNEVEIDKLLVVTFTVLAAQEMKDRLIKKMYEKLLETENKQPILDKIEKIKMASIDTIDGFASKTIKKYFYELGISPNIEIVSDTTKDYYLSKAMKFTLEELQEDAEKSNLVLDLWGGNKRNFEAVSDMILETYNNVISFGDYDKFLDDAIKEYTTFEKSELVANQNLLEIIKEVKQGIIENLSSVESEVCKKIMFYMSGLENIQDVNDFKKNVSILLKLPEIKFSKKENEDNPTLEDIKFQISKIKDLVEDIDKNLKITKIHDNMQQNHDFLVVFIEIVKNFIKNYTTIKEKNNVIDFNDLNRFMIKLLNNEKIKSELQQKYSHIFIDEYQDVNPLQDSIMSMLAGPKTKVFMVGDVKQSIYGFRGASPEWFLKKYNKYKLSDENGHSFDMNINFRSSPKILLFINEVFSSLMTVKSADIDYKNDCMIEPKRNDIVEQKVNIVLFSNKVEKSDIETGVYSVKNCSKTRVMTAREKEAFWIAQKIQQLVGTEFYDANKKVKRLLKYSDIALLGRSEKDDFAKMLIDNLKSFDIPVKSTDSLNVSKSEGVKLLLSILKCTIGLADDVDYFATFYCLTKMTFDELVSIRNVNLGFKENLIMARESNFDIECGFMALEDIKKKSYVCSNSELLRYILNLKFVKNYILAKQNGKKEYGQVEEFLNKLGKAEDKLSLSEFVEVVESNVNKGGDFMLSDNADSVIVQTIHKSKGLEYPVVFLFGCGKTFLKETSQVSFNADIGLGIDSYDLENRSRSLSLPKYAIKLKNEAKSVKEEMCLLYVALTRAKNKLFITGDFSPSIFENKELKFNSYLNMILSSYFTKLVDEHNEFEFCDIDFVDEVDSLLESKNSLQTQINNKYSNFNYKHNLSCQIPFENSVTNINKQNFITELEIEESEKILTFGNRAEIGTLYHKALEKLDLKGEYLQNTNFDNVDYSKIKQAHRVLSKLVEKDSDVIHEAEFTMYVPYCQIADSKVQDKVLLNGVADLIIKNKDSIVLVDYKFSSLKIDSLKQKYSKQLGLYKLALEKSFKLPVKASYIYSINTGELA